MLGQHHLLKTHLEELHSYTGKHEIQQHGDQDDVADGFNGHKHALDHMLSLKKNSNHLVFIQVLH